MTVLNNEEFAIARALSFLGEQKVSHIIHFLPFSSERVRYYISNMVKNKQIERVGGGHIRLTKAGISAYKKTMKRVRDKELWRVIE